MKTLAVIFIIILFLGCVSPPLPQSENIIQTVIEVDKSKDAIFRLSNEWLVKRFVSAKAVIQYQDKEEGVITGKGRRGPNRGDTEFIIKIEAKDKKARITFSDMQNEKTGNPFYDAASIWNKEALEGFRIYAYGLTTDYKKFIETQQAAW